jgi:hypothetical protein
MDFDDTAQQPDYPTSEAGVPQRPEGVPAVWSNASDTAVAQRDDNGPVSDDAREARQRIYQDLYGADADTVDARVNVHGMSEPAAVDSLGTDADLPGGGEITINPPPEVTAAREREHAERVRLKAEADAKLDAAGIH